MTKKFGVSVDDATAGEIENLRIRTDPETDEREIVPRSEVVQELLGVGLAATKLIESSELDLDPGRPREAFVRQAVLNELSREGVENEGE